MIFPLARVRLVPGCWARNAAPTSFSHPASVSLSHLNQYPAWQQPDVIQLGQSQAARRAEQPITGGQAGWATNNGRFSRL